MSYDDEKPMVGSYQPAKTRRRCCVISVLAVALAVLLVLAIAIPVAMKKERNENSTPEGINNACVATSYPDDCRASLQGSDGTPLGMSKAALYSADSHLADVNSKTVDPDCKDLLETAREQVQLAYQATGMTDPVQRNQTCADVQTGLSAALEGLETCKVGLTESGSSEANTFPSDSLQASKALSNSLALVNCLCLYGTDLSSWKDTLMNLPDNWNFNDLFGNGGTRRRLMNADFGMEGSSYEEVILPSWINSATSRHLLARPPAYNVIVAKDGTGKYKTVTEAINKAPATGKKDAKRYIIYVKKGIYDEQIVIPKKCTNLMIIGDGIDLTIFTGARSVEGQKQQKMTTFGSGTLIVTGPGFIGKFFTVRNTAGAAGHQAVACRVSADLTAFYRVKFDSYQDTLYCHTFRQFYRECIVSGTVDFMFGNGNAVFQQCQLIAKKTTLPGQQNTYTAQGRIDPHQNTGLAFQDCNFDGTNDLKRSVANYPHLPGPAMEEVLSLCPPPTYHPSACGPQRVDAMEHLHIWLVHILLCRVPRQGPRIQHAQQGEVVASDHGFKDGEQVPGRELHQWQRLVALCQHSL
ncbi:hypothetical protein KC19_4G109900 [Ceratodon purpureus]|uniref:Pectinesterase inhibitor domain-containing protein n=1 Tax=Ceratodon purpureus TaxID=3225 RepID=A0A8T0I7E7_CERPU|nr:hypothetical protein KC19_4G109900 [Ceratodon purpureus]